MEMKLLHQDPQRIRWFNERVAAIQGYMDCFDGAHIAGSVHLNANPLYHIMNEA